MKIRPFEERDIRYLQLLHNGFHWELDSSFIGADVVVDEDDIPRMIAGAWAIAEVHLVADGQWDTPAFRAEALRLLHISMNQRLKSLGIRRGVTWFNEPMRAFERRLRKMGWIRSEVPSYHKGVR
jgi:hypothetical protein